MSGAFVDEESLSLRSSDNENSLTKLTEQGERSQASVVTLAHDETMAVNRSKRVMFSFLLFTALGLALGSFFYLRSEETKDFSQKFSDMHAEIATVINHEAIKVLQSVESLSLYTTSHALSRNATLPFVTLPDFEAHGSITNELAQSLLVGLAPLIRGNEERLQWEEYSVQHQEWIKDGLRYAHQGSKHAFISPINIAEKIFRFDNETAVNDIGPGPFMPVWQLSPAPANPSIINFNLLSNPVLDRVRYGVEETRRPVLSEVTELDFLNPESINYDVSSHPHSFLLSPVFENISTIDANRGEIVATVLAVLPWNHYLENILADNQGGATVVFKDTCGDAFTYELHGPVPTFLGYGDLHDTNYDHMMEVIDFSPYEEEQELSIPDTQCQYTLYMYASQTLEDSSRTAIPFICAGALLLVFFMTFIVFSLYDLMVTRRQDKVTKKAIRANAIVSSLFPSNVRERIMQEADEHTDHHTTNEQRSVARFDSVPKHQLKTFLDDGVSKTVATVYDGKPIADLFPEATVLFADIAGFTAWSSEREPAQVFQLLETLYNSFDEIAVRRRVFKVETIGDCYVAVAGLPTPRKDHAIIMARFSREILKRMNDLVKALEVDLGPGTGDLCLRVGLHSGPVTAGVLRGDRPRFQLFGDTVNTASRMESTGIKNRIHISQETADSLERQGKKFWFVPRPDKVVAKGKGELQTFWLDMMVHPSTPSVIDTASSTSSTAEQTEQSDHDVASVDKAEPVYNIRRPSMTPAPAAPAGPPGELVKTPPQEPLSGMLSPTSKRLVTWNSEMLIRLLKQVVARRKATSKVEGQRTMDAEEESSLQFKDDDHHVIDEVKEIITLPKFNAKAARNQEAVRDVKLLPPVVDQLREYVTIIACMYRDNPFHNFEHASHVTMSVVKLLSRIVAPDDVLKEDMDDDAINVKMHDHTYGITSDPLTQFAVVMSALIHDVDHNGVPNAQLVREKASVALFYNNKSVAEQNSVDLAWELLFDDAFKDLRQAIAPTKNEMNRFRQLIVNTVMATDIVDKELKKLRNDRWDKAFHLASQAANGDCVNRKATIVIEHLIQASDVAHTMQHWHIYQRWNERFFEENMKAYKEGRSQINPADFWYNGEIGFFDFYIIPLAKKLKDCGVFGVSSDEYLNYATRNRKEWHERGQEIVKDLIKKYA